MSQHPSVLEFKCPCCNASLAFSGDAQQMKCEYCDNTFDLDTLQACKESDSAGEKVQIQWDEESGSQWNQEDQNQLQTYLCDSCSGELITDDQTAATFCPYCGNSTILPGRLSGGVKPEGVIPFKTTKDDAIQAFLKLCKGKPLLPKCFTQEQRLEKITGIYVPFWLYDCSANLCGNYKATRIHTWSDNRYIYTKTDHYLLRRQADVSFSSIPMDGSSKMEDSLMESIEPYDYKEMVDFEMAYLSGYFADKHDVESNAGEERIRQRVETSINDRIQSSFLGYATVVPTSRNINIDHSKAKYVLLPVWILNTNYKGKIYTFAMNGQTGKMIGQLPICAKRSAAWFAGLWAGITAAATLIMMIL